MSRIILEGKFSGETQILVFDFTAALASGETISSASTASTVFSGTDASPSAVISGTASISGAKVSQKVTGGTAGVIYDLVCTAVTSLGQTLQLAGYLAVLTA